MGIQMSERKISVGQEDEGAGGGLMCGGDDGYEPPAGQRRDDLHRRPDRGHAGRSTARRPATATSSRDGDQCTLRAAIQEANATPGADLIRFFIPGTGVKTISVNSTASGRCRP